MDLPWFLIQNNLNVLTFIVSKLSQTQNINKVDATLGRYYQKIEKVC
jgi:hypothetical protein